MAVIKSGLTPNNSLIVESLGGPGPIAFEDRYVDNQLDTKLNEIIDYIRLRLADGIVDVELGKEHYDLAIQQAFKKYRQRSSQSTEESYAFLDLLPETQEYILPRDIVHVRQVFRRGIGSVTGTTASQFEPFASGYLNTYMLVAGRVGGLANYELFTQYQEQAMRMFGGHMNFTWNPATRKLTIVRKIPDTGKTYIRPATLTSNGLIPGSIITLTTSQPWAVGVGNTLVISNCAVGGYNGSYTILTANTVGTTTTVTFAVVNTLAANQVIDWDRTRTQISSPTTDMPAETVLLHIYNRKPDVMLLNDPYIFPWLQDYAYAISKSILGEARSKFASLAGPQGGTQLNGTALVAEAKEEIQKLEEDLKNLIDGSQPLTWVIG